MVGSIVADRQTDKMQEMQLRVYILISWQLEEPDPGPGLSI